MATSIASRGLALLSSTSWTELIAVSTLLALAYAAATVAYNLYLHPLRHYPGPASHAATSLPWGLSLLRGTLPADVYALHEAYGPVVRLRPGEIAYADAQSWQDIYGIKAPGRRAGLAPGVGELPKHLRFYKQHDGQPDSIITAPHGAHGKWRRALAPGFSDKSLRAQEPLIMRYIDLLIARLRERSGPARGVEAEVEVEVEVEAVDLTTWYNWATFDIIGDLAFGSSFGCLEDAKDHVFVNLFFDSLKQTSRLLFLRHMGLVKLASLAMFGLFRKGIVVRKYGTETLKKRIAIPEPRPDLVEPLLAKKTEGPDGEAGGGPAAVISLANLSATASTLLVAGSETTASTLAGVTWLLLTNPEKMEKLKREVRGAFEEEGEINFTSVQGLGYMLACLNEGLRLYPPVAIGLPRQVPRGGAVISGAYVPEGTVVSVYQWSANHLASNWTRPFEYIPERFLGDDEFRDDKQGSMKPFSMGPRDCIGKNLAYVEMRVILARIIWNFDMKLAEKQGGDWIGEQQNFILWRKVPLNVVLTLADKEKE